MRKYTANYVYTNPNFVIQNLDESTLNSELFPLLCVLKNILQRGFPTVMSKYLQSRLGEIHKLDNFNDRFLFAINNTPKWIKTIKGNDSENYFPAKEFFENILPRELGEFSFVQALLIPEIEINDIVNEDNNAFKHQQVDFYLPLAKLVIEIDGRHHIEDDVIRNSDRQRDDFLSKHGVTTIRIDTSAIQDGSYKRKINCIVEHLKNYQKMLDLYRNACAKIEEKNISRLELDTKIIPTAIIRFQILLIELLLFNHLTLDKDWNFNIKCEEELGDFAELAVNDLWIWLEQLYLLKNKHTINRPKININLIKGETGLEIRENQINVDFSLFKRYTDEHTVNKDVIFVRTDYFDIIKDKNYFRVSTATPINYHVTEDDKPILEFFLTNIFDKPTFRDGQFPIISNVLNRNDTIGLLPTGGGKSLCYQLPCLLQPCVSFVVCPIKSLMYDQNDNLGKILVTNVNFITSDLDIDDRRRIESDFENGRYLFVWISPEKLQIPTFRNIIRSLVANFTISYAVIDEVHCLSEWGHDFRTSYLNLARTIDKLSPKDEKGDALIKFIGLTATASVNVLKDIKIEFSRQKRQLEDENIKSLLDYSRKELQFVVVNDEGNKYHVLQQTLDVLRNNQGFTIDDKKAGLVFTPNVNGIYGCYELSKKLNIIYSNKVGWFSGESPKQKNYDSYGVMVNSAPRFDSSQFNKYKKKVQNDFKNNKIPLLVATKSFGMGIDKQNVYYTFHYGLPSSVEALYQEAGRAGRWDRSDASFKNEIAKCYVLHSPEIDIYKKDVEKLFQKDTTFSEIEKIKTKIGYNGGDIFRQIFLFTQGQNDIVDDFECINKIVRLYFKKESIVRIFWSDARYKLDIKLDILQKEIYRLSLLGVVRDWATDFSSYYEVQFGSLEDGDVIISLSNYLNKYDPTLDVRAELEKVNQETLLERAIWYLLQWIFDNITYNRKQSLKTLSDWCVEYKSSDTFKERIDNYFIFTESTFVIQYITENPRDYNKWFEVLFSNNVLLTLSDLLKLKDSISRFLESYRNNIGLNFLSGCVRLMLNEYDDTDGRDRFEASVLKITQVFTSEEQADFLGKLKRLGDDLSEDKKMELCLSICRYYPHLLEELAERYELIYMLNEVYAEGIKKMKILNMKLYEQFRKI